MGKEWGTHSSETLAFRADRDGRIEDWGEVAGHPHNGATLEEVRQEILENDGL